MSQTNEPSRRGRKPGAPVEPISDAPSAAWTEQASQASTDLVVHQEAVVATFGDGLAYERQRVVHEAQFYMGQSAEAMLQAGSRLILLKEHEAHGEFLQIVENQLGINARTAQLMMAAAAKFLSPALASKAKSLSLLGKTKLFDLMAESDEDLLQLADGGTLHGHTRDDIDSMTGRELKAALRDSRQQNEAKEKVLADRNAKIDRLEQRLHRPYKPSKESAARTAQEKLMLDDLAEATTGINAGMVRVVEVMTDMAGADVSATCRQAAANDLIWLGQRLALLMREHGIAFDLEAEVVPEWIREQQAKVAKARGQSTGDGAN